MTHRDPPIERPDDPPTAVRSSCRRTMLAPRFVTIDDEALDRLAAQIPALLAGVPADLDGGAARSEPGPHDERDVALRVLALDAINFGSGYHDSVRKEPGLSGARTMATRLERYVDATGPFEAVRLRRITVDDASQVFGQELDGGALEELMTRFAAALADLGQWLSTFDDDPLAAIAAADRSAARFTRSLLEMPYFRDAEQLDGEVVHFYKRAQITAADLDRRLGPIAGGPMFDDLAHLTAFADNLVPHVLRVDGVLRYDPELAAMIDRGDRLEPGGRPEIEIRAAGVEVVERLAARTGARPMDIDEMLWLRGGAPEYKAIRRHRARSLFY